MEPNYDLAFSPTSRDLLFNPDGTLQTVQDQSTLSTQNGTILLLGQSFNVISPAAGIGYQSAILGNDAASAAFNLNRWTSQVSADNGAAAWQRVPAPANVQFDFQANVSYQLPTA